MKLKLTADEDADGWTVADAMDPTEVVVVLVMAELDADEDEGMENRNGAGAVVGAVVEVVEEPKLNVTCFVVLGGSVTGAEGVDAGRREGRGAEDVDVDVDAGGREGTFGWSGSGLTAGLATTGAGGW